MIPSTRATARSTLAALLGIIVRHRSGVRAVLRPDGPELELAERLRRAIGELALAALEEHGGEREAAEQDRDAGGDHRPQRNAARARRAGRLRAEHLRQLLLPDLEGERAGDRAARVVDRDRRAVRARRERLALDEDR